MMNLVYAVGVFLLYMPPLMVFMFNDYLRFVRYFLYPERALVLSIPLVVFMLALLPSAWIAWFSYFLIFNIMSKYTYIRIRDEIKSFSLSIYSCFAISVLWEWPYQLSYTQNIDAVYMSSLKALGIPFFLFTVYKLGWRPEIFHISSVLVIFAYGILALLFIEQIGMLLHLYRLPWLIFLIMLVPDKHLNKSTNPKR